jgi:hypothetical protein
MIPKEKAEELLNKFSMPIDRHKNIYYKRCALIAVDEILNEYKSYNKSAIVYNDALRYWDKVKQEIEKL